MLNDDEFVKERNKPSRFSSCPRSANSLWVKPSFNPFASTFLDLNDSVRN